MYSLKTQGSKYFKTESLKKVPIAGYKAKIHMCMSVNLQVYASSRACMRPWVQSQFYKNYTIQEKF